MNGLRRRLTAIESVVGTGDAAVVAFMIDGASDDDVIAVRNMYGNHVERSLDESLGELVERMKACQPRVQTHVLFFEYPELLRLRLGKEYMPEALPNYWPVPNPPIYACHEEHRP